MNRFKYSSRSNPCPVCGRTKDGDCRVAFGTERWHCRHSTPSLPPVGWRHVGTDRMGFDMYVPEGSRYGGRTHTSAGKPMPAAMAKPKPAKRPEDSADFRTLGKEAKPVEMRLLLHFSQQLGLSVGDLLAGGIKQATRWQRAPNGEKHGGGYSDCLVWDEFDGAGNIVGRRVRFPDGSKLAFGGAGITYDPVVPQGLKEVHVVEGLTDQLTLKAMGLYAIGRSNNLGNADEIVQWVQAHRSRLADDFTVVVHGENDEHPNALGQMIWPGRDGVNKVSQAVADALGCVVEGVYPPDGAKDAREWYRRRWEELQAHALGSVEDSHLASEPPFDAFTWFVCDPGWNLGREYSAKVREGAVLFSPPKQELTPEAQAFLDGEAAPDLLTAGLADALDQFAANRPDAISRPLIETPAPDRTARMACPDLQGILLARKGDDSTHILSLFVPCKRLACDVCGRYCRDRIIHSVNHHLRKHAEATNDAPLHAFSLDAADRPRVTAYLRAKHADYFCCDPENKGHLTFVSTHAPANVDGVREMTAALADAMLKEMVNRVPKWAKKFWRSSRGWKLIEDKPKTEPKFERVCEHNCPQAIVEEILESHGETCKPVEIRSPYFPTRGIMATLNSRHSLNHLMHELNEKQSLPIGVFDQESEFASNMFHRRRNATSAADAAGGDNSSEQNQAQRPRFKLTM